MNYCDQLMDPALYEAIRDGNLGYFQNLHADELLQKTADGNDSCLHLAVNFEREAIAKTMIDISGSLVSATNSKGDSPLHIAAKIGSQTMVQLLIDRASDIEIERRNDLLKKQNHDKDTALHDAVRNGHLEVVKLLIREDPYLTQAVNGAGDSPLFLAVDRKFYDIASEILKVLKVDYPRCSYTGRNNMNVLHAAVIRTDCRRKYSMKDIAMNVVHPTSGFYLRPPFIYRFDYIGEAFMNDVRNLYPCTISETDTFGWIPLHHAAYLGYTSVFEVLLNYDVSLSHAKDNKGKSAVHISAKAGHSDIVGLLMKKCPDTLGLLDNKGRTALHIAAEKGRIHVLNTILMAPNQVVRYHMNGGDKNGNTPLHLAALGGHRGILYFLADDVRVDKRAMNNAGLTALDLIQSSKLFESHIKIINYLKARGALGMVEYIAIKKDKKERVQSHDDQSHDDQSHKGKAEKESQPAEVVKNDNAFLSAKEKAKYNLVVSTIIISITFSAIYNLPGGLFTDKDGHSTGKALLSGDRYFKKFILCDSAAFGLAFSSILLHFIASTFLRSIPSLSISAIQLAFYLNYISIIAMAGAFTAGLSTLLPEPLGETTRGVIYLCSFSVFILWTLGTVILKAVTGKATV